MPSASVPSTALLKFLRRQAQCPKTVCAPETWSRAICGASASSGSSRRRYPNGIGERPCQSLRCEQRSNAVHLSHFRQSSAGTSTGRGFSTSAKVDGWKWSHLWRTEHHADRSGSTRGLPPLASFLDDNNPEFDEKGQVQLMSGEFKKSELIAKYGLLPRDLRKIDSSLLPSILVRPSAILINLLHLRVLIKHNRVLVFDAYGSTDSYTQSVFMYDLEGKLQQVAPSGSQAGKSNELPYEHRALEAVLLSVTGGLESEFEGVREPVVRVLRELEEDIDRDKLRYLLIYSKKLGTFEQKARLVRDALDELLEADDDLADMYLTEKQKGEERPEDDHAEVELMLESYHKVTDEIVQAAGNLVTNIRNTEEIVRAILDSNRNSLMLLDLRFTICALGLGAGTFIAALYGMNLKNFIEESDYGFWSISGVCSVASVLALAYGFKKLRRVQRVSMWGQPGNSSWTPWSGGPDGRRMQLPSGVPVGASGLNFNALGPGGGTAGLGALDRRAKHEYWLRKRQEHFDDRKRRVQEKWRAKEWHGREKKADEVVGKGGEGGAGPEGGYC